jgi:serine/threonine-protein kinase
MASGVVGAIIDGKYRVERELSRGGMGTVYVATHVHLGTTVAVKLLHDGTDDEGRLATATTIVATGESTNDDQPSARQFLREARLAAHLRHPNLVQVLDFGVANGVPYLVMELVPGESLRARLIRAGRLSLAETSALLDGVAAGLAAAHAGGVIHRDLKPDNIVFDHGERPKVVDFGLAIDPSSSEGGAPSPLSGTPAYLSPEQATGDDPVTDAADRWALGVIAFECLTGRTPFAGESLGEIILQLTTRAAPVPSNVAEVPAGFDAWFARACARDPADRFATATEMSAALTALLPAPPVRRTRRRLIWLGALALVATPVAIHFRPRAEEERAPARPAIVRGDPNAANRAIVEGDRLRDVEWQFAAAAAAYERAVALDPANARAYQRLALIHMVQRRFDDAITGIEHAIALDPRDAWIHRDHGQILYYAKRFEASATAWRHALTLEPDGPFGHHGLGYALVRLGQFDAGLAEIRRDLVYRDAAASSLLAAQELWVAHMRGDAVETARLLAALTAAHTDETAPWMMAFVYATLDRPAEMYARLDAAFAAHDPWMDHTAVQAEFDRYRSEPRFVALMARLGL